MGAIFPSVFVHIVSYNSADCLETCLRAVCEQSGFQIGQNLKVLVTDNASLDGSYELVTSRFAQQVESYRNHENLGFCGGHNQGVFRFLQSEARYFLVLNPDVRLEKSALMEMVTGLESEAEIGSACPRLYRSDEKLNPIMPLRLDAAGMYMTPALRHFDRGSGQIDSELYNKSAYVFGGSGACIMLRREFILDAVIPETSHEDSVFGIYPQLQPGREKRTPLFDEAFFAYREDADLAWRGQLLGWKCLYVSAAIGFHRRVVLPERRQILPAHLNLLGVKNRFLLQLNNYQPNLKSTAGVRCFFEGFIVRSALVVIAVLLRERTSIAGLIQAWKLMPRALARRRLLWKKLKINSGCLQKWFDTRPVIQLLENNAHEI